MTEKQSKVIPVMAVSWILLLFITGYISPRYLPQTLFIGSRNNFDERLPRWLYDNPIPRWIWMWANLDGGHYVSIARDGYYKKEHGFFPLYPLAIRYIHGITSLPFIICGLLISSLAFLGFLRLLFRLAKQNSPPIGVTQLFWWLVVFPTAFFLIAVYNDSLYLFLTASIFYSVHKKQWWYACIAAYVAGLTRITALALFPAFMIEGLQLKKDRLKTWGLALFAPLGILTYLGYLELFEGGWHVFFDSMAVWGQSRVIFPLQTFWRYAKILVTYTHSDRIFLIAGIEFSLMILAVALLILGRKMVRKSWWVYALSVIILPSTSGTGAGFPRYFIHAFPLFFIMVIIFEKNRLMTVAMGLTFLTIQLLFFFFFSQGYFVS